MQESRRNQKTLAILLSLIAKSVYLPPKPIRRYRHHTSDRQYHTGLSFNTAPRIQVQGTCKYGTVWNLIFNDQAY